MKTFLLFILLLSASGLMGQNKLINFSDCKYDQTFVAADFKPTWNDKSLTIYDYLNKYFSKQHYVLNSDVNGKVILGIVIYQDGKPCCHSFMNVTSGKPDPEQFKNAVNDMPNWKPAKQMGKEVIFLLNIPIGIKNGIFQKVN